MTFALSCYFRASGWTTFFIFFSTFPAQMTHILVRHCVQKHLHLFIVIRLKKLMNPFFLHLCLNNSTNQEMISPLPPDHPSHKSVFPFTRPTSSRFIRYLLEPWRSVIPSIPWEGLCFLKSSLHTPGRCDAKSTHTHKHTSKNGFPPNPVHAYSTLPNCHPYFSSSLKKNSVDSTSHPGLSVLLPARGLILLKHLFWKQSLGRA